MQSHITKTEKERISLLFKKKLYSKKIISSPFILKKNYVKVFAQSFSGSLLEMIPVIYIYVYTVFPDFFGDEEIYR